MKKEKLFEIGERSDNGKTSIYIDFSKKENETVSPIFMANMCIYMYDITLSGCEDSSQVRFEKRFKECFDELWENRHDIDPKRTN